MAYTFDRINTLFRGKDDQGNVMGDKRPKTVASGDVSSTDATGGEAATPQSFAAPSAAAIQRNVSKARTPEFTTRIQGQIEAGNTGLDTASSKYSQGYKNKDYGVSADDINAAVSGNAGKLASVQTRMSTPQYGQVEAFKPEVDTEIEDAALLGSEGGTKRLLARQGGNKYNAGEAAFDVSLLRRSPGFNQIADQLSRGGKELSQKSTRLQSELPQAAQQTADTKYVAGTDAARSMLGTIGKGIVNPVTAKAAEISATRAGLRTTPNQKFISTKDAAAKDAAGKELSLLNPRAAKLLGETGIDPLKYYGVGKDVSASDLYSQDDAFKFNNIQQILGGKNLITAGQGAGDDEYFDDPSYTSGLISRASSLRGTRDQEQNAAIQKIMNDATTRVNEYNNSLEGEENDAFNKTKYDIASQVAGIDPQMLRDLQSGKKPQGQVTLAPEPNGPFMPFAIDQSMNSGVSVSPSPSVTPYQSYPGMLPSQPMSPGTIAIGNQYDPFSQINELLKRGVDPNQVINRRARLTANDVLTPEEASQINASIEDLGSMQPKAKGSTDWKKPVSINSDALRKIYSGR